MKIIETSTQKKIAELPTQLDLMEILDKRSGLNYKEEQKYIRLRDGALGEEDCVKIIASLAKNGWVVIQNLWMDQYGAYESDLILITLYAIYVFEIKNYNGHFEYENGICLVNGQPIPGNCISQIRKAYINMKNICKKAGINVDVHGVLVFIGEHNTVNIHSPVDDIDILLRHQLKKYILQIIQKENHRRRKIDLHKLLKVFDQKTVPNPYSLDPISEEELKSLRSGIYCANCGNFNLTTDKHYVKCSCGMHESRVEAVIRTICEFGALNYERNMTRAELLAFLDNQVSHNLFLKIINEHFKVIQNGKYTFYKNKKLPYHKIENQFQIVQPKFLISKNQCLISGNESTIRKTISKLK